jgi:hypothetical protein
MSVEQLNTQVTFLPFPPNTDHIAICEELYSYAYEHGYVGKYIELEGGILVAKDSINIFTSVLNRADRYTDLG